MTMIGDSLMLFGVKVRLLVDMEDGMWNATRLLETEGSDRVVLDANRFCRRLDIEREVRRRVKEALEARG